MAGIGGCDSVFSALLGFYPQISTEICPCIYAIQIFVIRKWSFKQKVIFTSLIIQFVTLAAMIATAKILSIEIGAFSLFGIMAASLLASRLPISVAGVGGT